MSRKPRICVVGSLNIDFVTTTPRIPGPGETLTANSMTVHAGGKGANQAVACGKAAFISTDMQDVQVEMIGAVGANDPYFISLLKPTLEKGGVNTRNIDQLEDTQTGTATILVEESGENRILIVPGANARVTNMERLIHAATAQYAPEVLVMQGEIPRDTVLDLLSNFNNTDWKTCVVFNPAPMYPDGIPVKALQDLGVLVVNETECRQLFEGIPELVEAADALTKTDINVKELDQLATRLRNVAKISIIVVTLGSRGVYYSSAATPGRTESRIIPAEKVAKVIDTTAAGDSFVGYLATALARYITKVGRLDGFDIDGAARIANKAAAKCVQTSGAMESIPFGYE
jgi:ribokinase